MVAFRAVAMACALAGVGLVVRAQAPAPDPRLTIADVEKVSGVSGVKQVAQGSMTGAGGALNFTGPDGKLILMVNFATASLYDGARKNQIVFHAVVPDVGDEAFDAPPGTMQYVLYVKKGAKAVSLTSFLSTTRPYAPKLTMDQLKALARVVLPRL
jgi:hypothetical protein